MYVAPHSGPVEPIIVKAAASDPRDAAADTEGQPVDFLGIDPDRAGHGAVMHHGPHFIPQGER